MCMCVFQKCKLQTKLKRNVSMIHFWSEEFKSGSWSKTSIKPGGKWHFWREDRNVAFLGVSSVYAHLGFAGLKCCNTGWEWAPNLDFSPAIYPFIPLNVLQERFCKKRPTVNCILEIQDICCYVCSVKDAQYFMNKFPWKM